MDNDRIKKLQESESLAHRELLVERFRNPLHVVTKAEQIKAADTIQQQAERIRELEAQYNNLNAIAKANLAMWKLKEQQLAELKESAMLGIEHTNQYTSDLEQQLSEVVEYAKALQLLARAAYPVSTMLDKRGYQWSQTYLDEALARINALPLPKAMQP